MALTLTVEDGTGKADANSYASVADGDAYHDGHLYATAWTGATTANKEKGLVMATRLIDAYMVFGGARSTGEQALQWPRLGCLDPDQARAPWGILGSSGGGTFDATALPAALVAATCELARELLVADRTAAPLGEGLVSSSVGDSTMVFDRQGRAPVLSRVTIALLGKLGVYGGDGSGMVRLKRG